MTSQQRFEAAVKVIRNLPKNGSYQPSNTLMLNFYAYFKQATEGPVASPRPSFYNVVGRAKWDAWKRLGDMPKEEAMDRYVDDLNKIIETMALTDNVADFLKSMEAYPGDQEDIELSIGPLLDRVRSKSSSTSVTDSQESTPSHKTDTRPSSPYSEEEFLEPIYQPEIPLQEEKPAVKRKDTPMVMPMMSQKINILPTIVDSPLPNGCALQTVTHSKDEDHVSQALQRAVVCLRKDLTTANEKVKALEDKHNRLSKNIRFQLNQMAPGTLAFIVLWPVVVHYVLLWLRRKK